VWETFVELLGLGEFVVRSEEVVVVVVERGEGSDGSG
jgi:hypothetical protein